MVNSDEQMKAFLTELESEIGWEWHWEKRHRRWTWGVNWATWVARVFLLALSTYQLSSYSKTPPELWVLFSVAFLSVMNMGLPLLSVTFRFQQRQEVHDRHAREYAVIKVEILSGRITFDQAVERFTEIRRQPTEAVIRRTP
ncbi:MAG: hypothetical protein ACHQYP_01330 [Nitrospiria bacterium]